MSLSVHIEKKLGAFTLSVRFETRGGVLGILGASGSGKSKTLQCIAGIERPDAGRIVLNGRVLFDSRSRTDMRVQDRHVGYLFQNYALFPHMTVEENIYSGIRYLKDKRERQRRVDDMIGRMHLTGLSDRKPGQLSGGQQQRTALARCLINEPDILLLDEPFSALDTWLREQLLAELKQLLTYYDKDVLIVTHNRDEAYQLCQRIVVLEDGRVDSAGPVQDIFSAPPTRAAAILMGCRNIAPARFLGEEIVVPDWNLRFHPERPVPPGLCAVAIGERSFVPGREENGQAVTVETILERPFSWLVQFRYRNQKENTPSLWWQVDKTSHEPPQVLSLGVSSRDILLLHT